MERKEPTALAGNEKIAAMFEEVANLLEVQKANAFQLAGWRAGARTIRASKKFMGDVLSWSGRKGLIEISTIGRGLASAIEEIVHTGELALLERLRGAVSPEDVFTTVPGLGEHLAALIHEELHIDTLEELELAAHDGRLATVPGIGEGRLALVRDILAARLSRSVRKQARQVALAPPSAATEPSVWTLLEVDRFYRARADAGELPHIAPRRFNPEAEAWLLVMHEVREGWHFTAMYSNTARAHKLGRTRDWVVIVYYQGGHEAQCTAVTEHTGALKGLRVVRGREPECRNHYEPDKV